MDLRPSFVRKAASRAPGGAGDLAAIIYDDGVVLDVSPGLKAFIGAEGSLVGRSLFEFVGPPDRPVLRAPGRHRHMRIHAALSHDNRI